MNKRIFACIIIVILISALISGCAFDKALIKTNLFEYLGYSQEIKSKIVCDRETKVMYAITCERSMTLLVDETGNPKLWKGDLK